MNFQARYNLEPVTYCAKCLSLDNPVVEQGIEFCKYCGSTKTKTGSINMWENRFMNKYNLGPYHKLRMSWKEIMTCASDDMQEYKNRELL